MSNKNSSSNQSPISNSIRELTLTELQELQQENTELQFAIQQLQHQIQHVRNNNPNDTNSSTLDLQLVKAFVIDDAHAQSHSSNAESSQHLIRQNESNIIITNTSPTVLSDEKQVNIVTVSDEDWWTIINPTDNDEKLHSAHSEMVEEDGYIIISENDACNALADFISQSVLKRHPSASRLTPDQLRKALDSALSALNKPSTLQNIWSWGRSAYTTYGWLVWAYGIYKEPAMVGLVATTAVRAASYLLVCVV